MEELVMVLLEWLSGPMKFTTADMPAPTVIELSAEELTQEAYTDNPGNIPTDGVDERVFALYSWDAGEHGEIYILDSAQTDGQQGAEAPLENPIFQERLLHELVHHVQHQLGQYETFACDNEGELQAYQLGGLYLKQRAVEDPLMNRDVLAYMFSRC